jgi:hypothetical protein
MEPASGGDRLARRRGHVEQAMERLAGVELEQDDAAVVTGEQPREGGGDRRLADAPLARHDDELRPGEPARRAAAAAPHQVSMMPRATWSAIAMMVIIGFTPVDVTQALPSAT